MRLLALVHSPDHVCCRYRLAAFHAPFKRAGHTLRLHPWPKHWWAWPRLLQEASCADAVIVQRKLPQLGKISLLRRVVKRLIFDFDDAIFARDSYSAKGPALRRQQRFAALCRLADAVIAGNSFLRDQALRWAPAERVHLIPTCIDSERYPEAVHRRCGRSVQLVWIGSSSTLRGLEAIRPVLERLGQRWPGLSLRMICDRYPAFRHLTVLPVPWTEAGEASELAAADIGFSWMPDDVWSRGKCGLKVLQYMAAGLPVVANRVGVHLDMVRHGENGFLADTLEEWEGAIGRLAHEPDLRRRQGIAGRRHVQTDYAVSIAAVRWLEVLAGLEQEATNLAVALT